MKKIMFNDKYGLTKAVLEGRKTMTRRIAEKVLVEDIDQHLVWNGEFKKPKYKVGEVVAVAQNLRDTGYDAHAKAWRRGQIWGLDHTPAWTNKMFVSAWECIHQIRITNVRVERLQDISDEDCIREGIVKCNNTRGYFNGYAYDWCYDQYWDILAAQWFKTQRAAFAALIDKVSGKGTFERNPWVFVYEFELVK